MPEEHAMTVTNSTSGTNVHEIAPGIHRISTPVPPNPALPLGFTFNQFLVVDDEPLLFHTGPRKMFPLVREAVAHVLGNVARLRWVSFSHFEADECGSMDLWLEAAPKAEVACSAIGAMVSVDDVAPRPARGLKDGEEIALGKKRVRWLDAPHLPHNWECGYLFEATTKTMLCGDLFTHAGADLPPITEADVLGPAEVMRAAMPASVAVDRSARGILDKLAACEPRTLALMHGSSFRGDGAKLLQALAGALGV
jgi:glyoxylase-like metal-dependent hydrolase (beta-lactamase superfamily II)